jgi:hypothetical protein
VYDLEARSCSYVLAGHTETVLCLDTCVSTSGRTLIVTGSKDNSVSSIFFFCPQGSCGRLALISSTCVVC